MNGFSQAVSCLTDKNGAEISPIINDASRRDNAVLIINLAGDDAYAQINGYILQRRAGTAAEGASALAQAANCSEVIVYSGVPDAKLLAEDIKTRSNITVSVMAGPASPVLRDDTALFSAMENGVVRANRAEHEFLSGFQSYGYMGRPTVVVDGETAYRAGRLSAEPGALPTKLISISSADSVKEVPEGTSVSSLLKEHGLSGVSLIGGVCGRFYGESEYDGLCIGHGYEWDSIRVFREGDCIVDELVRHYSMIYELQCSKCVLCREGSKQLHAIFSDIAKGRSKRNDLDLIADICPIIHSGALCSFGKNMVMPALTSVSACLDIIRKHTVSKTCPSGRCAGLMKYIIDPSICDGCGDCADSCPEDAIDGKDGFIHVIDDKLCDKCGECVSACPSDAIKPDNGSIRTPKKPVKAGMFK